MERELMEIKESILELHGIIIELSEKTWQLSAKADELLMSSAGIRGRQESEDAGEEQEADNTGSEETPDEPTEPEWKPQVLKKELPHPVQGKGRPRKAEPPAEPPENPQREPRVRTPPPVAEATPSAPEMTKNQPQTLPEPPKQGIVERLLGKDASDKAKLRAERMKALEAELAELSRKK